MSYDQWRTGMWTTSVVSAVVGALIWILWGTGADALFIFVLACLLLTLVALSFQRPRRIWAVNTQGFSGGKSISKTYGPFHSKHAAFRFRKGWDTTYEGFAVVEYRTKEKLDKH